MSNNKPDLTLLILAGGMGSRYGGIKQIDGFGPNGETIVDYSIYDAIRAGFTKVVFIVREDIKDIVREKFENKLKGKIDFDIVIQSVNHHIPEEHKTHARTKPWGTGHAMICAKDAIKGPFVVINADDFYGKESFKVIADYFKTNQSTHPTMVGYTLKHVLSDNGSVTRGVGETDKDGHLIKINERKNVRLEKGKILSNEKEQPHIELNPESPTSMNFWGFYPDMFDFAQEEFEKFLKEHKTSESAEFLIPIMCTTHIEKKGSKIKVLKGSNECFGVTYKEDKDLVAQKIKELVNKGEYPHALWK